MYDFILQTAVILSLGVIIYLLARAAPRVGDSNEDINAPSKLDKLMAKVPVTKIDAALNSFFEKVLRKFKVVVMKIDNLLNARINKLNKLRKDENDRASSADANPPSVQ